MKAEQGAQACSVEIDFSPPKGVNWRWRRTEGHYVRVLTVIGST